MRGAPFVPAARLNAGPERAVAPVQERPRHVLREVEAGPGEPERAGSRDRKAPAEPVDSAGFPARSSLWIPTNSVRVVNVFSFQVLSCVVLWGYHSTRMRCKLCATRHIPSSASGHKLALAVPFWGCSKLELAPVPSSAWLWARVGPGGTIKGLVDSSETSISAAERHSFIPRFHASF
jgi:hypothetical protein